MNLLACGYPEYSRARSLLPSLPIFPTNFVVLGGKRTPAIYLSHLINSSLAIVFSPDELLELELQLFEALQECEHFHYRPCFSTLIACNFQASARRRSVAVTMGLHNRFAPLTVKKFPRRVLVEFVGFSMALLCSDPVFAAPMPEMKEPEVIRTLKLESGVRIQEITEGDGPEAHEGDSVEINYVCRRSNGYFVHSTVDQLSGESSPVILPLDEKQIIEGLKEVLVGMKAGGKRRALIPPWAGYVNENLKPIPEEFGPRRSLYSHANEPLIFEVQLLKVL